MEDFRFQLKENYFNEPLFEKCTNKHHKMVARQNYERNKCASAALKNKQATVYQDRLSVSMGVVFLNSTFLVYIQQSTAVMLCTAAHVHPCRV